MPPSLSHQMYTSQRTNYPSSEEQPSSHIPSLLRVLDANLHPQPHRLSPLAEQDEHSDLPGLHSQLTSVACTTAPKRSVSSSSSSSSSSSLPSPTIRCHQARVDNDNDNNNDTDNDNDPRQSLSSYHSHDDDARHSQPRLTAQRTRETDPYPFNMTETLGLQTARLLPVQCVSREDIRCGQVTIPHRWPAASVGIAGGYVEHREFAREASSSTGGKKSFGVGVRRALGRIRGWFCQYPRT